MPSVDDLLQPGERVLFQARRRGHGLAPVDLLFYVQWLVAAAAAGWVWDRAAPPGWLPFQVGLPATLLCIPVCLAVLLYQLAAWRAHQTILTDRRLLLVGGVVRQDLLALARTGREHVRRRRDGDVVLEDLLDGPLTLPGLDDADLDALRTALGQDPSSGETRDVNASRLLPPQLDAEDG